MNIFDKRDSHRLLNELGYRLPETLERLQDSNQDFAMLSRSVKCVDELRSLLGCPPLYVVNYHVAIENIGALEDRLLLELDAELQNDEPDLSNARELVRALRNARPAVS